MGNFTTYRNAFLLLMASVLLLFLLNLSLGSVSIPFKYLINSIFHSDTGHQTWNYIIFNYRIPKAVTAILVGSGLSISGLLMQTLFRNPLAGPFVLGISSGASLGVAIAIIGGSLIGGAFLTAGQHPVILITASSLGSVLVLAVVMLVANRVRNTMAVLIIGLMFGSFTAAIISVLAYFGSAENLQQYLFWSFGSLGNISQNHLWIFLVFYSIGVLLVIPQIKSLNALLLGENYAQSMGVQVNRVRNGVLLTTGILTGVITAFAGPIAFIGLAVPHIGKLVFNSSDHRILIPAVGFIGADVMLLADIVAGLPGSEYVLPINAITTLFGAPIVIWLLIRKKRIY